MLSIKPIGGSAGEVAYYSHLGDAENLDYYSADGDRPGIWWGEGSNALGLTGEVSPDEFANVLQGVSPDGKKQLVQLRKNGQSKRRAGFDLTWSLPKSFSVFWSQANRETKTVLDKLAAQALYNTLGAFQDLCGSTRRGKNGAVVEFAKLVTAIFSHDTARGLPGKVPDANRHFHVVVANVVVREDGSTGSLDARPIFRRRMKMALGALFRAELSMLLEMKLGLQTYRPERETKPEPATWWELVGVPTGLIKAMSKRRQQIERWLTKRGLTGAKAAEKAALHTRQKKSRFSSQELHLAWEKLGREHGFSQAQIEALLLNGRPEQIDRVQERQAVVALALNSLMEGFARFSEIELLERTAIEAQTRGIGISDIRTAVETNLKHSKDIVRLQDLNGVRTYTTREMLQLESALIERANRLQSQTGHAIPLHDVQQVVQEEDSLSVEQAEAVRQIAIGGDIVAITGVAGSGKTFMLNVMRDLFEQAGYKVLGTALAAKAARGLGDGAAIESIHLHQLLGKLTRGTIALDQRTVLVVDEAGMIGTRQLEKLTNFVEQSGAKLVLVGDHRQLQAIDAGAPFRAIGEAIGTTEITKIIRQRKTWARRMVKRIRDGKAFDALKSLEKRGQLFIGEDREAAMEKIVCDWQELALGKNGNLKETLVFAGTNLEVRELNQHIQLAMEAAGQLGEFALELNGQQFHLGDRLLVTKNNQLLHLQNGMLGEVTGVTENRIWVRLDDGFEVEINSDEFKNSFTLGYAMSVHKGQGVTCENALILTGNSMTDRELSYVAASRSRGKTNVYADGLTAGPLADLAKLMSRSRQKEMARDHRRDIA